MAAPSEVVVAPVVAPLVNLAVRFLLALLELAVRPRAVRAIEVRVPLVKFAMPLTQATTKLAVRPRAVRAIEVRVPLVKFAMPLTQATTKLAMALAVPSAKPVAIHEHTTVVEEVEYAAAPPLKPWRQLACALQVPRQPGRQIAAALGQPGRQANAPPATVAESACSQTTR